MKLTLIFVMASLAIVSPAASAPHRLEIYTIDVEGGKSVLFVSPSGESMLLDAGWPQANGREASVPRILDAMNRAGVKRIDHLVISHFDIDHIGDVPQLASRIPVGHIYDHGDRQTAPVNPGQPVSAAAAGATERFNAYDELRRRVGHTVLKVGDRIPLKGVTIEVITAGGKMISSPMSGAGKANPLCATNPPVPPERDVEDNLSIGLLIRFGNFRLLDLADLEAHLDHELVCPTNLIGTVDAYHVNVHGQLKGIAPELIGAVHPQVALMGNGARKGADPASWPLVHGAAGVEDIWQDHYSARGTKETNPLEDFVANMDDQNDAGNMIKLSAETNGTFSVTNTRNGFQKTYRHKP